VTTVEDMVRALELRRDAHQFYGLLPEASNWRSWSDRWDETAFVVLISLGAKAVATGRVVVNGGDPGRSEIEQSVSLPGFLWSASFAEASELAIHPAFRNAGLKFHLFREIARLALSLGSRFLVVAAGAPAVPRLMEMGAIPLELTKACRRSGESEQVLYFDLRSSLPSLRRASANPRVALGSALGRFKSRLTSQTRGRRA
jgi:GNAT superfamily N-acetyltransferase